MKPSEERLQIRNSHLAANYLKDKVSALDHEELWALYLTKDLSLIVCEMLTKGSLEATIMDSRTVIRRPCLRERPSSLPSLPGLAVALWQSVTLPGRRTRC